MASHPRKPNRSYVYIHEVILINFMNIHIKSTKFNSAVKNTHRIFRRSLKI